MIHIKGHNTQLTMQIPGKQVSSLPYKLMTLIQLLITRGISSPVACTPQRENRFKLLVEHLNTNANNLIILVLLSNSKKSIKNVIISHPKPTGVRESMQLCVQNHIPMISRVVGRGVG